MAVIKVPQSTVLGIKVQSGVNGTGAATFKTTRFSGVKQSASDADFYEIANGIAGLQSYPLNAIQRMDTANMVNS